MSQALNLRPHFVFFCLFLAIVSRSALASEDPRCFNASAHALSESISGDSSLQWRGYGAHPGVAECFSFDLTSVGTLMLEASPAEPYMAEPRLEFLGQVCDLSSRKETFRYRSQYAQRLDVKIVQPGLYTACIASQDPESALGAFRVLSVFLPARLEKEEDPDEHEPDPDPLASRGFGKAEDPDEHEPDPDPFACFGFGKAEDPDEHEPDPDPIVSDPTAAERLRDLCQGISDDHGDSLLCATSIDLGAKIAARIHNPWSDDQDVFTFVVDELTTVRLTATGNTSGSLLDRAGQRLHLLDSEVSNVGWQAVKTFSPGRYFVRIDGADGTEGGYRLEVETLD